MRSQTTIDFAIGISVFLVTVAAAFAFVPGMLEPFTAGNQEETVAANRVASQLATATLARPERPYALDTDCTEEFFSTAPSGSLSVCAADGSSLREWIGLRDRQSVNITITGDDDETADADVDTLCWDGTAVVEEDAPSTTCTTRFQAGGTPPTESGTVTVATRTVLVDGYDATLEVTLWR